MSNTTVPTTYGSSPVKRARRTRDAMDGLKSSIVTVLTEIQPATVRQTYYQLVSRGVIPKTDAAYKGLVRVLTDMRRAGQVRFGWIADNTRWMRKPRSHQGLQHLLNDTARLYRRDLWNDQDAYCEIWLEKDALAGVLLSVTAEFDVPLMVTRGYPSVSFLHSAAEAITDVGKPAHLYYFGDRDPSGMDIPRAVEAGIREFAPKAALTFRRVAVTDAQVEKYQLPTRPTKGTDVRSKGFKGESVEVDALPPDILRHTARICIERHINSDTLAVVQAAEESERTWLKQLAAKGVA